ncbi:uncharacterized protein LOC128880223 [Hylaeus volcanicus]|uniref:uncharacterized protein LOC128880223 n=1 Tax=Hylaeus volcanicus TaxID=313075 RepID=UPI0023B7A6A0|nr:uncharacterized protein LOC128880223 [Hylaeus volcanicus]
MDITDNADGYLDPRIQIELENLNDATDDINKLETELDEAHTAFRQLLSETTKRLKEILNKVGNSCVDKARCYYEALEVTRQAQVQCQQQAQLFQRASEIHAAAKETVAVAESRFMSHQHEWNFDQAWQDMLNHATIKVMDAENQKTECGREHYRRAVLFHDAKKKLLELEEKHRRSIIKARPYFEVKAQCDQMLATQKERVECLQKAIQDAKTNYATSLRRLEEISNQIHQQRRDYDFIANGPREPGVGAELVSPQKTSNYDTELNQLNSSRVKDITKNQHNEYDRIQEYNNTCQLQEDSEHLGKRSVDGSETTSSQWELEMQVNIKGLNNVSLENSVHNHDSTSENISNLQFYDKEDIKSNNFTSDLRCNFLQSKQFSMHDLNQDHKLLENFHTSENPVANMSLMTRVEGSDMTKDKFGDSVVLNKSNLSKSLANSPKKPRELNLPLTPANNVKSTIKYVPTEISKFCFSNRSQSNSDINLSFTSDINSIEKYQSLDDILDNKTDNLEFDKQVMNSKYYNEIYTMNKTYNNGLNATQNVHSPRWHTRSKIYSRSKKEIVPVEKSFSSNSTYCLSNGASSSVQLKHAVSLLSENSSNREITDDSNKFSAVKKLTKMPSNVKELPLLSLLEKRHLSADSKGKSCSMINLDDKRNFMLLNDTYFNNTRPVSTEQLENLKDNLFLRTSR